MYIALCDDDSFIIEQLKELIYEYAKANRISATIDTYSDGYSLINSHKNYDFIVLDYQMNGINGLEAAKTLRSLNSISAIIFLTSYPQFMIDAFEVNTFRFLVKPIDKSKLFKALDDYIKVANSNFPITILHKGEYRKIESSKICFIEADGKYSYIHLSDEVLHCSKTLSGVAKLLPEYCFVKTHRSYVVNLHFVKSYSADTVYFSNNETAYISKSFYKPFRNAYMDFLDKYYVRL